MCNVVGLPWKRGVILALVGLIGIVPLRQSRAQSAPSADEDEQFIEYQLRPNDDPSKVARMFRISLEELLALNRIPDAHRLTVGTTLKIPDPRAVRVKQLAVEKRTLEGQLAASESKVSALSSSVGQLESQVADLRESNDELRSEQTLNRVWRVGAFIGAAAAAVLALALLLTWAKARDAERHVTVLLKEAEVTHAAIEKYRQLGAQFELKYQSLFHQVGTPSPTQGRSE